MNAALLKRLFRSISDGRPEELHKMGKLIIEEELKKGHGQLAKQLSSMLKSPSENNFSSQVHPTASVLNMLPRSKRSELPLLSKIPSDTLEHHMILPPEVEERFQRVEKEFAARERLAEHGLLPRKKILLYGPPGCGKSMGAQRLAFNCGLDFYKVRFDAIVSSYLGESASNLRAIFDTAEQSTCLVFIDEFDSIAKSRLDSQDVGEIKRIANSFLQLLDDYNAPGLLVCATNLESELDSAIWRRFDEVLELPKPGKDEIKKLILMTLAASKVKINDWNKIFNASQGYSAAQIVSACRNALKNVILDCRQIVTDKILIEALAESGGYMHE